MDLICFALIVAQVVYLATCSVEGSWLTMRNGGGVPADFVNVWAAGRMALAGHAASVYDWPAHKLVDRFSHGGSVVRTAERDRIHDVVDRAARRELIQEPEPLLRERQRRRAAIRARLDAPHASPRAPRFQDDLGKAADRGMFEHGLRRQLDANGLKPEQVEITEDALREIIGHYTRESGVRNLEREISKICRKVIKEIALEGPKPAKKGTKKDSAKQVTPKNLEHFLGVRRYEVSRVERPRRIVEVTTKYGMIPVKVAEGPFGAPQIKPELDSCLRAAKEHGVPVREVIRAAIVAFG